MGIRQYSSFNRRSHHHAVAPRRNSRTLAMRLNQRDDDVPIVDKVLSAAPYVLPIMDGLSYGR